MLSGNYGLGASLLKEISPLHSSTPLLCVLFFSPLPPTPRPTHPHPAPRRLEEGSGGSPAPAWPRFLQEDTETAAQGACQSMGGFPTRHVPMRSLQDAVPL